MSIANLSSNQLRLAAGLKEKIAGLEKQLDHLLGSKVVKAAPQPARKKGGMSAAGKARVAAAQKARWSKFHAAKAKTAPPTAKPAKKKFTMSAAARAKISAAAKLRWAKIKAAKK